MSSGGARRYVANVHRMLRPGGRYSRSASARRTPSGSRGGEVPHDLDRTRLYFSSEQELRGLFDPLFRIQELRAVEVAGRRGRTRPSWPDDEAGAAPQPRVRGEDGC